MEGFPNNVEGNTCLQENFHDEVFLRHCCSAASLFFGQYNGETRSNYTDNSFRLGVEIRF